MNKRQRIKKHYQEHKPQYRAFFYGIAAGSVIASTAIVLQATSKKGTAPIIQQLLTFGDTQARVIYLPERSTPSKPVHLVGTDLYFPSIADAARKTGHSMSRISSNMKANLPHANGDQFQLLELV